MDSSIVSLDKIKFDEPLSGGLISLDSVKFDEPPSGGVIMSLGAVPFDQDSGSPFMRGVAEATPEGKYPRARNAATKAVAVQPVKAPYKEPSLVQGSADDWRPSFIQRIMGTTPKITPQDSARAVMQISAKEQGLSVPELKEKVTGVKSDVQGHFLRGVLNEAAVGIPKAVDPGSFPEPETTAESISSGAGTLLGFVVGAPGKITKLAMEEIVKRAPGLALNGMEGTALRIGKLAATEAPALGIGFAAADTGEAVSQDSLDDALKSVAKATGSGVTMGATFGVARGGIPGQTVIDRVKRIAAGIAMLDVQRGGQPLDKRDLEQKVFDYGIDTFFLWKGIPRKDFKRFENEINKKAEETTAARETNPPESKEATAGVEGDAANMAANTAIETRRISGLPELKTDIPVAEKAAGTGPGEQAPATIAQKRLPEIDTAVIDQRKPDLATVTAGEPAKTETGGTPPELKRDEQDSVFPEQKQALVRPEAGAEPDLKPSDPQTAPSLDKGNFPVTRVKPADITLDPERFQFKLDTNKQGVQKPLQGEWNDLAAGNVLLWQDKSGNLFAANGHHRVDHAQRSGVEAINAQVMREVDGYTARDARNIAAEANILEGKGTVYDHAEYFRNELGYDDAAAGKRGVKGRGYAIGKQANDETYALFKARAIRPEHAEAIAVSAPGEQALQAVGARYALDHKNADPGEIKNFIRAMSFETKNPKAEQGDMFGYDDSAIKGAEAQAREVEKIVRELREEKTAISLAKSDKRIDIAKKHGIDVSDKEAVRGRMDAIDAEIESWGKWFTNPALVKIVREKAGLIPKAAETTTEVKQEPPDIKPAESVKAKTEGKAVEETPPKKIVEPEPKPEEKKSDRQQQPDLDGLSERDTFGLNNPETEWGKAEPKDRGPRNAGLFNEGEHAKRESETAKEATTARGENAPPERSDREKYEARKRAIVEMPELVEMAKKLMGEGNVRILRTLAKKAASGLFRPRGGGKIDLRADIFKDPEEAAKVMAHEIGHLADYVPDRDIKRGNILGRIASLKKYMDKYLGEYKDAPGKVLTDADRTRLKEEAARLVKEAERPATVTVESILKEVPKWEVSGVTPEMIKDILGGKGGRTEFPALYDYLAKASQKEKVSIARQAVKNLVAEKLQQFGTRKQVGTEFVQETVTTITPGKKATKAEIERRFKELLEEEITARRLFEKETITAELKNITQLWKPFTVKKKDKYTRYRHSSVELYADAFSVLMNDPAMLRKEAPTFHRAFFNWIDQKPEVKEVYDSIQTRLESDAEVTGQRQENIRESFKKGEESALSAEKKREEVTGSGLLMAVKKALVDVNAEALGKITEAEKGGRKFEDADNPRYWIEELPYISSKVSAHIKGIDAEILEPMKKDGITVDDIGEFMLLRRVSTERAELANPLGHTKATAEKQLSALADQLGPEKFAKLEGHAKTFWETRQKVIELLEETGMYSPELMKKIKDNENYATFDVVKALEKQYGRGVSGHIYKQTGTVEAVRNPFVATVLKDAALIRAAEITKAKQSIVKMFSEDFPGEIKQADTQWNGKFHEPVESKNPDEAMVVFLKDGKPAAFYLPKEIADTFNGRPYEANVIMRVWQTAMIPLRAVLVNRNPLWMVSNLVKDYLGTATNLPGMTASGLLKYYKGAFKDAYQDAFTGKTPAVVSEMLEKKMLVIDRQFDLKDAESGDTELDRTLQSYGQTPVRYRNMFVKPFVALWDTLGNAGKMSERWGKIAGYRFLSEQGTPERETAHIVRSMVATPDVFRRGILHNLTNSLFLFSNVGKEGFRSSWEAAKTRPGEYAWKTAKYNIVPKMIYAAAKYGLMGAALAGICGKVSEYDEENYTIVPIYEKENGKAVYLTLPQAYTGQVVSGLIWNLMEGKLTGKGGALNYGVGNVPYSFNPYVSVAADLVTYYLKGQNPYDYFRGSNVLTDQEYAAGGLPANKAMGRMAWNELGGSTLYRMKGGMQVDKATETAFEKSLKLPPLNVLGKFLKVSNAGEKEAYREIKQGVIKEEARRQLTVKDRIADHINTTEGKARAGEINRLYRDLKKDGQLPKTATFGQFRKTYERNQSKSADSPMADAINQASTSQQKAALLKEYKSRLSPENYGRLQHQLRAEGSISPGTIRALRELEKNSSKTH